MRPFNRLLKTWTMCHFFTAKYFKGSSPVHRATFVSGTKERKEGRQKNKDHLSCYVVFEGCLGSGCLAFRTNDANGVGNDVFSRADQTEPFLRRRVGFSLLATSKGARVFS